MADSGGSPQTGQLRAELAACQEALERAEIAVEQRDELLRTFLHELRTPASALEALIGVLSPAANVDDEVRRDAIELIALHIDHVRMLIDDVRGLRASGVLADAPTADGAISVLGDPRALHRQRTVDVVTLSLIAADSAGLPRSQLHLDVPSDAARLRTDPVRLRRIITNLLENAVQHGSPGAAVRVVARAGVDALEIVVVNQAHDGAKPLDRGGEGIGLRIVEHLARSLAGKLTVVADGPARTVTLRLPLDG